MTIKRKDEFQTKGLCCLFVKVNNHTTLTGAQINTSILKIHNLVEVEDLDYRKRQISNKVQRNLFCYRSKTQQVLMLISFKDEVWKSL
jgi:hypothetical protein